MSSCESSVDVVKDLNDMCCASVQMGPSVAGVAPDPAVFLPEDFYAACPNCQRQNHFVRIVSAARVHQHLHPRPSLRSDNTSSMPYSAATRGTRHPTVHTAPEFYS